MNKNTNNHKVAIVMGSQSDYSIMKLTKKVLNILKVKSEVKIISAHRTPKIMYQSQIHPLGIIYFFPI